MKGFFPIFRRQMSSYFFSPVAYVTMTMFLIVTGLNFWRMLARSMQNEIHVAGLLFGSEIFWIMATTSIALITMNLVAEEKTNRTIEPLLTAPITDTGLVLGKYVAAMLFFAIMCAPTFTYFIITGTLGGVMGAVETSHIVSGYILLALSSSFYIALGILISAAAPTQMVSAIVCFSISNMIFFSGNFHYTGMDRNIQQLIEAVSGIQHVFDFSRGIIDSRVVFLYLSGAVFLLFACVKTIESRHWK